MKHVTRYHAGLVMLYVVLGGVLVWWRPSYIDYGFDYRTLPEVLTVLCVGGVLSYLLYQYVRWPQLTIRTYTVDRVLVVLGYAAIFAIIEEIVFRGLVQTHV